MSIFYSTSLQDINNLRGTLDDLETLNEAGREKLDELRDCIEQLRDLGYEENNTGILRDAEKHRLQMVSTQQAFWTASISKLKEITKAYRGELLAVRQNASKARKRRTQRALRSLKARSSALLLLFKSNVEQMRSISQQLFDIIQKSTKTQDLRHGNVSSPQSVIDELQKTAKMIDQSHRLLRKYSRRECTDKILTVFGLTLFIACTVDADGNEDIGAYPSSAPSSVCLTTLGLEED
ncbi:AGAP000242-PA-like protein [Anopheles sinensis]|uniref:AGAP000242-PA-like protein n=1 Tax=Anopheles sinensis TaxID=74873 RepID=A0A084VLL7_ANOSI|nr:AGAP000242-PA-like protein [Anopheles sinensis]